jgi:hypothetical protein
MGIEDGRIHNRLALVADIAAANAVGGALAKKGATPIGMEGQGVGMRHHLFHPVEDNLGMIFPEGFA